MTRSKKKDKKVKNIGYATGSILVGHNAIKSGLPRLAGVRLESHSTSKKNARSILQNGGWLDPTKGGTGASSRAPGFDTQEAYKKASRGFVHITGVHKDNIIKLKSTPTHSTVAVLARRVQRPMYRLFGSGKPTAGGIVPSILGIRGKTLYTGGTDKFFNQNFIPDTDDLALKSSKPIKVYGGRFKATAATIKKEGLVNLMKANKGRVAAGAALTAGGLGAAGYLAKKALENVGPVKVKSFARKGKRVKAHIRKKK